MIVKGSSINVKRPTSLKVKIIVLLVMISAVFGLEFAYRDYLFKISINLIEKMQSRSSENFLKAVNYMAVFAGSYIMATIILIVYNFANIYKTYILVMILCVCKLLSSFFKLAYSDPRPYYYGTNTIQPYSCEGGYGNPSGHSMKSIAFYATIYLFIIDSRNIRKRKVVKWILLVFFSLLVCAIMISRLFTGAHTLNQILHGGFIGFLIYYFIFGFLELNCNDSKQFLRLVEMKNIYYLLLNIIAILPSVLVFAIKDFDTEERKSWKNMMEMKCEFDHQNNNSFELEAFLGVATFLSNICAFSSLKFEYYYTFNENIQTWTNYNFSQQTDDDSLLSNLSSEKDLQWNHTNTIKSFLRMVVVLILSMIIYLPLQLISDDANYALIFLFKKLLSIALIFLFMFHFVKVLLRLMKLVNSSVFVFTE